MLRADGSAAGSVEVTVVALREKGGIESAEVVGRTTTGADGRWSVPAESRDFGTRSFEVRAVVDGKPVLDDLVQRPGESPPLVGTGSSSALTLRVGAGRMGAGARSAVDTMVARPGQVEPARAAFGPQHAPVMSAAASTPVAKASCTYVFVAQNKYKRVWAPLKVSRTRSKSTLRYKWSTTKRTDLGVVLNTPSGKYMGGLTGSSHEESGMSIRPRWRNNESKLVKAQWRYRRYRAWCLGGPPPSDPPRPLKIWKWKPYEATGFTKNVHNTPTFKCRSRGPVANEVNLTSKTTVRWQGWFSIIGIGMDNTQMQTKATSLRIRPDNGTTPRYCGSAWPLRESAFVRELK
jgi:hypothetical protein